MFLEQLDTAGSLPALEATMRYASQRQKLLAHNIANLETPDFRPVDVSPDHFQRVLSEAIHDRRLTRRGGTSGAMPMDRTRQLEQGADGSLMLTPRTSTGNILFHDRNNRDLERMMQDLAENAGMFRTATDLMRNRVAVLHMAINERAS
jgi:flagellar basal-body rod protein FlgB